jgi:hypothetical protein
VTAPSELPGTQSLSGNERFPVEIADSAWSIRSRIIVALVFAIGTLVLVSSVVGVFGDVYGAADQGDGSRLMCSAHLVPIGRAAQLAYEVPVLQTKYERVRSVCASRFPTSRVVVLQIAALGTGKFDLRRLGFLEISLLAAVVGLGAFLLSARGWLGIVVAAVVLITAAAPAFARFFISPLSESSGLVGAVGLLLGAAAIFSANNSLPSWERRTALALLWFGAAYGGFAKPAYVGTALVGVAVLATYKGVPPRRIRRLQRLAAYLPGFSLALILLLCTGLYQAASNHWSQVSRANGVTIQDVNTHDFALLGAVPELERAGVTLHEIGLSPNIQFAVGTPFFGHAQQLMSSTAWVEAIQQHDNATRQRVTVAVLKRPVVLWRFVREAAFASRQVDNADLPASVVGKVAHRTPLRRVLDLPVHISAWLLSRWHGAIGIFVMLISLAAPLVVTRRSRRQRGSSTPRTDYAWLARTIAVAAFAALITYVVAVFGGGYWELGKHVLTATYFATIVLLLLPFTIWALVRECVSRDSSTTPTASHLDLVLEQGEPTPARPSVATDVTTPKPTDGSGRLPRDPLTSGRG